MRRNVLTPFLAVLAFAAPIALSAPAEAGIEACGDIHVEASAQCEVLVGELCEAQCEPLSFTAACYAECDGECNASLDVSCQASCEADCSAECQVDPGSFECYGSCEASCQADIEAQCAASPNKAQCRASLEASCQAECSASCEYTPPEASCEAKCEASCEGECRAEANASCQIDCQAGCTAELQGGCEIECQAPEGALFCDGQYVDHGGNLEECIESLIALFDIEVHGWAEGECSGNMCSGEAGFSCVCTPDDDAGRNVGMAAAFGVIVLAAARRRRRA
jgi:MYXO-CTERM domain-containing protein